ncbi:unnamed protein product [Sphagnum balticum]
MSAASNPTVERKRELCLQECLAALRQIAENSKSIESRSIAMSAIWAVGYIAQHGEAPVYEIHAEVTATVQEQLLRGVVPTFPEFRKGE